MKIRFAKNDVVDTKELGNVSAALPTNKDYAFLMKVLSDAVNKNSDFIRNYLGYDEYADYAVELSDRIYEFLDAASDASQGA